VKKKTAHAIAKDGSYHSKIPDESFCALELLNMGNELADFDGVNELLLASRAPPGLNIRDRRP
jgi:hypothetical protein